MDSEVRNFEQQNVKYVLSGWIGVTNSRYTSAETLVKIQAKYTRILLCEINPFPVGNEYV